MPRTRRTSARSVSLANLATQLVRLRQGVGRFALPDAIDEVVHQLRHGTGLPLDQIVGQAIEIHKGDRS